MAQSLDNKGKADCLKKTVREECRIIRKSIPDSCSHTPYCLEDAKRRRRRKESALPAHLLHQTCRYIYLSQMVRWKYLILCNPKWRKVGYHWHKDQVWLILMRLTHWRFNIVSNHIVGMFLMLVLLPPGDSWPATPWSYLGQWLQQAHLENLNEEHKETNK